MDWWSKNLREIITFLKLRKGNGNSYQGLFHKTNANIAIHPNIRRESKRYYPVLYLWNQSKLRLFFDVRVGPCSCWNSSFKLKGNFRFFFIGKINELGS